MAWFKRYRITSRWRLLAVLEALRHTLLDESEPLELILRTERVEKSDAQRNLFHAVCSDLAPFWGLTPGGVKMRVKASFYGILLRDMDGIYVEVQRKSEDSDYDEYSLLIDHAYQMGAADGIFIPDRRQM